LNRAAAVLVVAWSAAAHADAYLHSLAGEVRARLDQAAQSRAPRLVPPQPIAVHWKPVRIGSVELGAPLGALVAADLDGDRKAELYAVTSQDVIQIAASGRVRELARIAFVGDPAVPQPRDTVGAAFVDGKAVVASVSSRARGMRVTWQRGALHGDVTEPGLQLCAGERAQLAPGRNYFGDGTSSYFGVRCADLVDARGAPLHVRAQLSTQNKLDVTAGDVHRELAGVGYAFELADLDRDGTPEVVFSGVRAAGDPDFVAVVATDGDDKKPKHKKAFTAGGVVGIAVGDFDGDGAPAIIAAVRLAGSTKIDLWRLN
jgi:hypothetical protein